MFCWARNVLYCKGIHERPQFIRCDRQNALMAERKHHKADNLPNFRRHKRDAFLKNNASGHQTRQYNVQRNE